MDICVCHLRCFFKIFYEYFRRRGSKCFYWVGHFKLTSHVHPDMLLNRWDEQGRGKRESCTLEGFTAAGSSVLQCSGACARVGAFPDDGTWTVRLRQVHPLCERRVSRFPRKPLLNWNGIRWRSSYLRTCPARGRTRSIEMKHRCSQTRLTAHVAAGCWDAEHGSGKELAGPLSLLRWAPPRMLPFSVEVKILLGFLGLAKPRC